MSFFHLFSGKPVAKRHRWAKKSVSKPQLQTFILDAIETPSAILDSPDAHQDSGLVALVDHPIADLQWQGVSLTHALDSSHAEAVDTHGLPVSETVAHPFIEHIFSDQIEPLSFMDGYGYGHDGGYGYGHDVGYGYGHDGEEVVTNDVLPPGDHPATAPLSDHSVDPSPIISGQGYGYEATVDPIATPVAVAYESPHPLTELPATPEHPVPPEASGSPLAVSDSAVPASNSPIHPIALPPALGRADLPLDRPPLIGVIDTGFAAHDPKIDYSHVSLGHDYVDGDTNPLLDQGQGNTHGSHILDIITAHADHTNGSSPDLWLGRAIGSGHWADSLNEFVDEAKASGHAHAVVNLSFDLTQVNLDGSVSTRYELTEQEWGAISHAQQNGVLIVAASGNQGGAISALGQAGFDNILTVGAAVGGDRAHYSSFGSGLDLLAPGSVTEEGVGAITGTSAAAAEVTGAVSQVWAANPGLSYQQVIDILQSTATDLQAFGWDAGTGAGLLNVIAAVGLARITTPEVDLPTPLISPLSWRRADDRPSERAAEADDESNPMDDSGTGSDASGSENENSLSGSSDDDSSASSESFENQETSDSSDNNDSSNIETGNSDLTDASSSLDELGDNPGETSGNTYSNEESDYGEEGSHLDYGSEDPGYGNEEESYSSSSNASSNSSLSSSSHYIHREDENGSYTLSSSSASSESSSGVVNYGHWGRTSYWSIGSSQGSSSTFIDREDKTGSHISIDLYTADQFGSIEGYGYGNETNIEHDSVSDLFHQTDYYHNESLTTSSDYQRQSENQSSRLYLEQGGILSVSGEATGSITTQLHQQTLYSGETTGSSHLEQSMNHQDYQMGTSSGNFWTSTTSWQEESVTTSGSEIHQSDGSETQEIGYSSTASTGHSTENSDGSGEYELNQKGLTYSYSRSAQNGIKHWVLEISRQIERLTDSLNLAKAWSWIKTGDFTSTGDSSWTETLTQYSVENDNYNDQTSVISSVPDAESREEVERGDELAIDLLNFIHQHEDTQDLLNSENFSYATKLGMILDETIAVLEGDDKVQLQSQRESLLAVGQLVDAGGFHAALDSSLGGLFSEALAAQSTFDTRLFAHDFKWFVKRDEDDLPLKAIVFPTKLLAAVRATPALAGQLENPEFVAALMDLGKVYASLDPAAPVDPEAEPLNFFLDTVWNAQSEADLLKGGDELAEFISSFDSPAAVLRYEERLLKVVKQTPGLPEKQDAAFLNEVVQLGGTYAGLNPVSGAASEDEPLNFFLDTLWRSDDEGAIEQGLGEFKSFLSEVDDSTQLLKLTQNLLEAAQQVPVLQQQIRDPMFARELVEMGKAYAALDPNGSADLGNEENSGTFFLYALLKADNKTGISNGAHKLEEFLKDFQSSQRLTLLRQQRKVFEAAKQFLQMQNLDIPPALSELIASASFDNLYPPNPYQGRYGTIVGQNIALDYANKHPNEEVYAENRMSTLVAIYDAFLGTPNTIDPAALSPEELRRPDILNFTQDTLYEVKNYKYLKEGIEDRDFYIELFKKVGIDINPGLTTEEDPTVYGSVDAPDINGEPSFAIYASFVPGVILYKGVKSNRSSEPVPVTKQEILDEIQKAMKSYGLPLIVILLLIILSEVSRLFPLRNLIPIP